MSFESKVEQARRLIAQEVEARDKAEQVRVERNQAINEVLEAADDETSDNAVARKIGMDQSTFRSITVETRRRRRQQKRSR